MTNFKTTKKMEIGQEEGKGKGKGKEPEQEKEKVAVNPQQASEASSYHATSSSTHDQTPVMSSVNASVVEKSAEDTTIDVKSSLKTSPKKTSPMKPSPKKTRRGNSRLLTRNQRTNFLLAHQ